jgi:hypothetical protein
VDAVKRISSRWSGAHSCSFPERANFHDSSSDSGFIGFEYTDEFIRIFGNAALVRSKTTWKKVVNGKEVTGSSVYTDTYIKEGGRWWCVQAQITPIQ